MYRQPRSSDYRARLLPSLALPQYHWARGLPPLDSFPHCHTEGWAQMSPEWLISSPGILLGDFY